MKRSILAMGLVFSFLVFVTFVAFAQDPGDPTPSPFITIEWNGDGNYLSIDSVPELTLVSYQVVPGAVAPTHSYNFIVDTAWPRQMKWEAAMPESTVANPVKMEFILEMSGLPDVNPPGRWWTKMELQLALQLDALVGPPSEWSDVVYCIDWVQKKTGKPKHTP